MFLFQLIVATTQLLNESHQFSNSHNLNEATKDHLILRLESLLGIIEEILSFENSNNHDILLSLRRQITAEINMFDDVHQPCAIPAVYAAHVTNMEKLGRPSIRINIDYVELLHGAGYTLTNIACALQISRTTLWRRLQEAGITLNGYSNISDAELDIIVRCYQESNPNCGQALLSGYLCSRGILVQRGRIRESVCRIDPLRQRVRWSPAIARRVYQVPGANSLWHIDGRLEPIVLKNLPIIPSRTSQKFYPLFLIYSQIITYYSFSILLFYWVSKMMTKMHIKLLGN